MAKAGLIDEMMDDAVGSAVDGEDIEEEMEDQINQVLDEIAGDTLAALPQAKVRQEERRVKILLCLLLALLRLCRL